MKKYLKTAFVLLLALITLTACGKKSAQDIVSKELGLDVSGGRKILQSDTHSGNGDGTTCIILSFDDDTVLEKIKKNAEWKKFPLDETVQALVYGVSDEAGNAGPFLLDDDENPLVPEIQNGYYLLIDRQAEKDKASGADILHRGSFNFSLGLYDTDSNTLYFCQMDT